MTLPPFFSGIIVVVEILKIMVVFAGKIVYNNKAESLGKIRKKQGRCHEFGYTGG